MGRRRDARAGRTLERRRLMLLLLQLLCSARSSARSSVRSRLCSQRPCGYVEPRARQANRPPVCSETLSCCGNGVTDFKNFEQCDGGDANNTWHSVAAGGSACRPDCSPARCGDSVRDAGEECDSGDRNSNASSAECSETCMNQWCFSSPCLNGGTCSDNISAMSPHVAKFECRCVRGFHGVTCEQMNCLHTENSEMCQAGTVCDDGHCVSPTQESCEGLADGTHQVDVGGRGSPFSVSCIGGAIQLRLLPNEFSTTAFMVSYGNDNQWYKCRCTSSSWVEGRTGNWSESRNTVTHVEY